MLSSVQVPSPIGTLTVVATDAGLRAILWDDEDGGRTNLGTVSPAERRHPSLEQTSAQLSEYFAGQRTVFDLELDPAGTEFQRRVWARLHRIPAGHTESYGDIAAAIGRPRAARAVGAANGRNPLAIVVPCHRAIGADGSLTGFAGGIERKRWLLTHEGALQPTMALA